ncbi:amino acid permease [Levilactobacillus parabrevis]|uniref:Amino acid transporter n=1 Tax=Levilactobacillus parabrevis ATCC 53295 TaxID=1267003 RepID=A0A0R1GR71_9LACO|nr:amino acid permease [Levilactobacillus parabrevis]KRK36501.1 amino acid transporter [Levilactobacillus parabrevis ATCC 53295]KRO05841.1 amino acid transporter [Levilactobacillus parabrevis]
MAKQPLQLFIKKQVQTDLYKKTGLEKTLTAFSLTTMGIGAIVGSGIFITPGLIAANYTGPSVMLSYVIAVVVCAMAALCYSEFSSTIPLAGSAYTYVYAVFGEFVAWILGWALISEYLFAVSSVAVSWSSYFQNLMGGFGIKLPAFLQAAAGTAGVKGGGIDIVALLITMLVAALLSKGIRESARINNIMVIVKILVILLFIAIAIFYVEPSNYRPFLPFGTHGVFKGAAVAFYAYIGFDAVSTASEEVKNPKRNMPIGIISSLLVAAVLYIGLSAVLVGVVHYTKLGVADPVAFALNLIHQDWAAGVISFGAIVGMTTVLIVMSYGGTRLLFAISRDGLLPASLKKLHPRTHVPVANTWIFGIVASIFAAFIPIDKIAELVNIGTLSAFAMVSLGIVFLRHDERFKDMDTSFKVPWYPVLPIASFLACVYLMTQLQPFTWEAFGVWVVLGLIVYVSYGYHHSRVRRETATD